MSYNDGEALILAAVKIHANYDGTNVRRGDWHILNTGENSHYVILRRGGWANSIASFGGSGANSTITTHATYVTQLMLYQRYIDDGTSYTDLLANEETLLEHLEKYRYAGDTGSTILDVRIGGSEGEISIVSHGPTNQGPYWLLDILNVVWTEERTITYAE